MISHFYIKVFIGYSQEATVSKAASRVAVAALFVHAFGYAVGTFFFDFNNGERQNLTVKGGNRSLYPSVCLQRRGSGPIASDLLAAPSARNSTGCSSTS